MSTSTARTDLPPAARWALRTLLDGWGVRDRVDEVELVVSELLGNAVQRARWGAADDHGGTRGWTVITLEP